MAKEENEAFTPYDTDRISIDKKSMELATCLRRIEQGTIILPPDYQPNEVWNPGEKSRLIESILLRIPLPICYVSSDERAIYSVIDGLWQLCTIRDFVLGREYLQSNKDGTLKGNGFKLEKLEFWGGRYNHCTFNDLPGNMQYRIWETEVLFTIINPGTPEKVKQNISNRILKLKLIP